MTALRILIVDDDEDFADGLMEILELDGHESVTAHNGREAISAVKKGKFDVALIDIGLPDMNGAECLRAIRAIWPDLPCLLLTGYSAEDITNQGIEAGAVEVLIKPIDPDTLARHLATI